MVSDHKKRTEQNHWAKFDMAKPHDLSVAAEFVSKNDVLKIQPPESLRKSCL